MITDLKENVLLLKANYGDKNWGLPGGALDIGETVHEALHRECAEELGCNVTLNYLSGVYYHSLFNSQVFIFRCYLTPGATIQLSSEHTEFGFFPISEMSDIQRHRIEDCLNYSGSVVSARF